MVALIGEDKKLIIISSEDVPLLNKGRGVILQRYKSCECSDAITFNSENGLLWKSDKGIKKVEKNFLFWLGKRGAKGKVYQKGFSNPPKFNIYKNN